jgi:hypothetical protein
LFGGRAGLVGDHEDPVDAERSKKRTGDQLSGKIRRLARFERRAVFDSDCERDLLA